MCDMFNFLEDFDIAYYADDFSPYCAGKNAEFVLNNLEQPSTILFEWRNNNCMKGNTGRAIYYFQVILELPLRLAIVTLNSRMS